MIGQAPETLRYLLINQRVLARSQAQSIDLAIMIIILLFVGPKKTHLGLLRCFVIQNSRFSELSLLKVKYL
jgi:hypothetical protein